MLVLTVYCIYILCQNVNQIEKTQGINLISTKKDNKIFVCKISTNVSSILRIPRLEGKLCRSTRDGSL